MSSEIPSIKEWNHVLALASDPGLCGTILGKVENWILREVARREDTWDFLLGAKGMPKDVLQFCRAAKSAQYGAHRLARIARGVATPRSDRAEQYKAAVSNGDMRKVQQLEGRLLRATETFLPGRLEAAAPAGLRSVVQAKVASERARLARRIGRRKAEELWASPTNTAALAAAPRENSPREWLLLTGWLRIPNGDPGLCFFSKTALAYFFHHLGFPLNKDTDPKSDSRDRLRRLGLVQGPIHVRAADKGDDGMIVLTFCNGGKHCFKTRVETGARLRYSGAPSRTEPS